MIRLDHARSSRLAWALCTGIAMLVCIPASAQQTPAQVSATGGNTLEEVIVTAQKREQNVQNVPIAISAFTTETLRAKGVTDIHSLSNLTPNVNLDASSPFSGDTSVLSASIRGIGQDDFAFNIDPGVGVYLDGVFLARTIGANQNLLDVDRVEILKGPQGTLFGRNTIGGAINIVTHEPGTEARFQAQATGGSFSRADVGFTADLPITRQAALVSHGLLVAARRIPGRDPVSKQHTVGLHTLGRRSAERVSQGGLRPGQFVRRPEPAGDPRRSWSGMRRMRSRPHSRGTTSTRINPRHP